MWRRLRALVQKEFIQLIRERRMVVGLLVVVPLELLLFATAVHTDIKHIPLVVADQSQTPASAAYLQAFTGSGYFDVAAAVPGQADAMAVIDRDQASLGVVIPPDFASRAEEGDAHTLMLVDGASSFTAQSAYNAARAISDRYAASLQGQDAAPLTPHMEILYNPDLRDTWFITPGFLAILLFAVSESLTALAIVRERERGTIEALLVTPVRPFELMLAKMIPSLLLAFGATFSALLVATLVLGMPFRGNLFVFAFFALIDVGCGLGLGLVISSSVQTQNQAQQLHSMIGITGMFLGGLLFPTYALPWFLRGLSYLFPTTYFIPVVRGMALKGIGLAELWPQALALVVLLAVTLVVATRMFRQRLN
jgi:ABC-2 type transport system permease protein